jgi:hypothetical protein
MLGGRRSCVGAILLAHGCEHGENMMGNLHMFRVVRHLRLHPPWPCAIESMTLLAEISLPFVTKSKPSYRGWAECHVKAAETINS